MHALPQARQFARRGTWPPDVAGADLVVNATSEREVVVSGLEVLLAQGAAAFELWTGRDAPVEVMRDALGLPA